MTVWYVEILRISTAASSQTSPRCFLLQLRNARTKHQAAAWSQNLAAAPLQRAVPFLEHHENALPKAPLQYILSASLDPIVDT